MDDLDMTESIAPRSDQMNAEDLLTGPRTFTITEVRKSGSVEQPIEVVLDEFPPDRPFKPSKTVRRIMVAAWGPDAANYAGHRMTLYRDPTVKWAGQDVGGIRVSHMSHIEKRLSVALTVTRGKRAPYVVEPLTDVALEPEPPSTEPLMNRDQQAKMFAQFDELGIKEPDQYRSYIEDVIGAPIESSKQLTVAQASQVIESQIADLETKAAE